MLVYPHSDSKETVARSDTYGEGLTSYASYDTGYGHGGKVGSGYCPCARSCLGGRNDAITGPHVSFQNL